MIDKQKPEIDIEHLDSEVKVFAEERNGVQTMRRRAQVADFAQLEQAFARLGLQNPRRSTSQSFTQYTKEMIKQYLLSPASNIDNIRAVSQFLARVSMLYKKILTYYPSIPTWNYNVSYTFDFANPVPRDQMLQDYQETLRTLYGFDMGHEFTNAMHMALRDGLYVGFKYELEDGHSFLHALNPRWCKVIGKNAFGVWVVAFNAAFFDSGNNIQFIDGIDGDGEGVWDEIFIEGYRAYQNDRQNCQWFELPAERTCVLFAGADDEFEMPLPYFLPLFTSLLDLLDLEQILMDKTELENYAILLSKIPLMNNSEEIDDYAISLDAVQQFQALIEEILPEQVGAAYAPFDIEPITFNRSNTADDTDKLQEAMNNLFSNAGISELVVAGGSSTNSVGLKHSIQNDEATAFVFVQKLQTWMRYVLYAQGKENYIFSFHRQSYFTKDEYINRAKDFATLGGSAMDYYTAQNMTPYEAYNKILTEMTLDIKSMMIPLQSSYNMGASATSNEGGAPEKDEDELSDEGIDSRDANKNEGTRAAQ